MKFPPRRQILNYDHQPMDKHFDDGFGWMAEQFHFAAISTYNRRGGLPPKNLPTLYLFTHSIELYLKSFIIILKKSRKEPLPKWLFNIHNITKLSKEFRKTHEQFNLSIGRERAEFGIEESIWNELEQIGMADYTGDYFRYPMSKQKARSDSMKNDWINVSKEIVERRYGVALSDEFSDTVNVKAPDYLLEDFRKLKRVNDKLYEIHFLLKSNYCNRK